MLKYNYFVSYMMRNEEGSGAANAIITTHKKIESDEDILNITEKLKVDDITEVVVMNFQLL